MRYYWRDHLLLPVVLLGLLILLDEWRGLDLTWARALYDLQGGDWALRHAWLMETVVHDWGQDLSRFLTLLLLGVFGLTWLKPTWRRWRAGAAYLLLSLLLSVLLVGLGKQVTDVACPWNLQRFGGDLPYSPVFDTHPASVIGQRCFPAGHASAAYGWFGVYHLLRRHRPQQRWLGLAAVIAAGMLFGGVQQLRGAHFLSHDLWTILICWSMATLLAPLILRQGLAAPPVRVSPHARMQYTGGQLQPPP